MASVSGSRKGKGKTSPVAKKSTSRVRPAVAKPDAAPRSTKSAEGRGKVPARPTVSLPKDAVPAAAAAEPAPPPVERAPPPALPIPIASFTF
jgi:hypothetical protein